MAAMKYFMKKLWSNERGRKIKCNEFKSVRDWAAGWRWSCPSGAGDDDDMICLADAACCRRCDYPQILATRLLEINHDPFERPFPRNYSIGWRQRPRHTAQKKQKKITSIQIDSQSSGISAVTWQSSTIFSQDILPSKCNFTWSYF